MNASQLIEPSPFILFTECTCGCRICMQMSLLLQQKEQLARGGAAREPPCRFTGAGRVHFILGGVCFVTGVIEIKVFVFFD